jgi:hypothetical protein
MFEMNNHSIEITSPLENYFEWLRAQPSAAQAAIRQPALQRLLSQYIQYKDNQGTSTSSSRHLSTSLRTPPPLLSFSLSMFINFR